MQDSTLDDKDKIIWKGVRGATTTKSEFGDPLHTESYAFCMYDNTGLILGTVIPAGGTCAGRPCWSEKVFSYTYKDKAFLPDGIYSIFLKQGLVNGTAKFIVKARGAPLDMPNLAMLQSPVTVQLKNSSGKCWGAVYSFPPVGRNDGIIFKDKAD